MMHHDPYAYWRSLVEGKPTQYIDDAQAGFYRIRRGKGEGWIAVAIWPENGELRALVGSSAADPIRVWRPGIEATTEEAYRAKMAGTPYRDEYLTASGETTTDPTRAGLIAPRRHNGDRPSEATTTPKDNGSAG